MPITPPVIVIASHLRVPLRLAGRSSYWLETDSGSFYAATSPDAYDSFGTPITLNAELSAGSVVRVSVLPTGEMVAIQLITPYFENPFIV